MLCLSFRKSETATERLHGSKQRSRNPCKSAIHHALLQRHLHSQLQNRCSVSFAGATLRGTSTKARVVTARCGGRFRGVNDSNAAFPKKVFHGLLCDKTACSMGSQWKTMRCGNHSVQQYIHPFLASVKRSQSKICIILVS